MTVAEMIELLLKYHKPTDVLVFEWCSKEELEYDDEGSISEELWAEMVRRYMKNGLGSDQIDLMKQYQYEIESEKENENNL